MGQENSHTLVPSSQGDITLEMFLLDLEQGIWARGPRIVNLKLIDHFGVSDELHNNTDTIKVEFKAGGFICRIYFENTKEVPNATVMKTEMIKRISKW